MAPSDPAARPRSVLLDCLTDPANAADRLPYVLSLLDADDRGLRVGAAWACCLVAVETGDDDVVEYLVARLGDRLSREPPVEVTQALDYLAARYPEHVGALFEEDGDEARVPEVGSFTRNHYHGGGTDRPGQGRTRVPEGGEDDPRQTYADPGDGSDDPQATGVADGSTPDGRGEDTADQEDTGETATTRDQARDGREHTLGGTDLLSAVAARSRFDELHIVGAQSRGRYADTYQALLGRGGEEEAVAVRLLRRPGDRRARAEFAADVSDRLRSWARASGHDGAVTVLDWGPRPKPWVATAFTAGSLAELGPEPVERPVADARRLAGAVSHLHQQGIVHGGIDPRNVVYPGELLAGPGVGRPLLDNVGLMHAYRYHFDPTECLSPRYAAPEYFDDRFGRVDHGTDIYGLGAVLYRLFTGRPPYTGGFEAVKRSVVGDAVPRPSEVADVPPGVDEVVTKAMAPQKIARYETVEHLQRELTGIDG